tara:strand:- start:2849 stop:3376 length:528 start_codon:yes stop_codon:yes gene_type:complete
MIYLIPKCFSQKKEFIENCFKYIDSINKLKIDFNSKKSIFPRLSQSKKRGQSAVIEILNLIEPSFLKVEHQRVEELIFILKWNLRKSEYKGIHVLTVKNTTADIFNEAYFPLSEWSHIPETEIDLLNSKINIMSETLFIEDEVIIDKVGIIKSHIENYVITQEEKIQLIKYIINN